MVQGKKILIRVKTGGAEEEEEDKSTDGDSASPGIDNDNSLSYTGGQF